MKSYYTLLLVAVLFVTACSKKNMGTPPVVPTTITPTVATFAGTGSPGLIDGAKSIAAFRFPTGLAIDASDFLFVADKLNNVIRLVSPSGVVTTVSGNGKGGFSNTTDSVTFNFPAGIAIDANDNIFVADLGNSAIREVTTKNVVSTIAGTGVEGFKDSTGTAAKFNSPSGIVLDAAGNMYVADPGNNRIRKITPQNVVTTFAGNDSRGAADGTGAAATFNQPLALTIDAAGNLYVADSGNDLIRKITPQGVVTTLAGSGNQGAANGVGAAASFNGPGGIALDAKGNLYVADTGNNIIRKITPDGTVSTLAGTGAAGAVNGALTSATFNAPQGIAVDSNGRIFVADTGNSLIRVINQPAP